MTGYPRRSPRWSRSTHKTYALEKIIAFIPAGAESAEKLKKIGLFSEQTAAICVKCLYALSVNILT